eukprot:TRINITY_DN448_c0_g1_i2.p1 TRINITY_DN448_c0_g1~~TRINITY_DN448_c0_g1_i2.p1  ORF type:complete len:299 (+),score=34.76 TRINITY_DN448_c0_g1_i2:156-1052(+)
MSGMSGSTNEAVAQEVTDDSVTVTIVNKEETDASLNESVSKDDEKLIDRQAGESASSSDVGYSDANGIAQNCNDDNSDVTENSDNIDAEGTTSRDDVSKSLWAYSPSTSFKKSSGKSLGRTDRGSWTAEMGTRGRGSTIALGRSKGSPGASPRKVSVLKSASCSPRKQGSRARGFSGYKDMERQEAAKGDESSQYFRKPSMSSFIGTDKRTSRYRAFTAPPTRLLAPVANLVTTDAPDDAAPEDDGESSTTCTADGETSAMCTDAESSATCTDAESSATCTADAESSATCTADAADIE